MVTFYKKKVISLIFFAQILPYVNGTLYSLLTNPKIAASARSLHISEKLKLAITATANDPDLGGRVYTIVKFLEAGLSQDSSRISFLF